jgi:hypothetical protein
LELRQNRRVKKGNSAPLIRYLKPRERVKPGKGSDWTGWKCPPPGRLALSGLGPPPAYRQRGKPTPRGSTVRCPPSGLPARGCCAGEDRSYGPSRTPIGRRSRSVARRAATLMPARGSTARCPPSGLSARGCCRSRRFMLRPVADTPPVKIGCPLCHNAHASPWVPPARSLGKRCRYRGCCRSRSVHAPAVADTPPAKIGCPSPCRRRVAVDAPRIGRHLATMMILPPPDKTEDHQPIIQERSPKVPRAFWFLESHVP